MKKNFLKILISSLNLRTVRRLRSLMLLKKNQKNMHLSLRFRLDYPLREKSPRVKKVKVK